MESQLPCYQLHCIDVSKEGGQSFRPCPMTDGQPSKKTNLVSSVGLQSDFDDLERVDDDGLGDAGSEAGNHEGLEREQGHNVTIDKNSFKGIF